VIAIPHCLPGETVLARVYANERMFSKASLIQVIERPAAGSQKIARKDDLVGCKYFGRCSGCQYQMLDYDTQLELKQSVVARAFRHYAKLSEDQLPSVLSTLPSPLRYNYRTKLTPHFELPNWVRKSKQGRHSGVHDSNSIGTITNDDIGDSGALNGGGVDIGFDRLGGKGVLDIEECPIATRSINTSLPAERKRIKETIGSFKNGATLLLRDSLRSFESVAESVAGEGDQAAETEVITNHKMVVKERVGAFKFDSPAGAFFQNNRSVLPSLLAYVQEQVERYTDRTQDNFLVDAYCGSGLFAICLAGLFTKVAGVEISQDSIRYAKQNAVLNSIANVDFLAGDAQQIFQVSSIRERMRYERS
jgi:tRNA (uracil-5-)-methyltransferase